MTTTQAGNERAPSAPLASSDEQLSKICAALVGYRRLPFAGESIPGAYVEAVIAKMRGAEVLRTYDFVDVVDRELKIGWQVKSTMADTPVTWKRAKIPRALELINDSRVDATSERGLQALGDAVIEFCNEHARESMRLYSLNQIGYARVYVTKREIVYFERELLNNAEQNVFNPEEFTWRWSVAKKSTKKEQLPALHGYHQPTSTKWWAWHGLGENQLHFSGEGAWWPSADARHRVVAPVPDDGVKITFEDFVDWIAAQELDAE